MKDKKSISIRIEGNLLQKLRYVAKCNGRSANGHIVLMIRRNVMEFERKNGEITDEKLHKEDFYG